MVGRAGTTIIDDLAELEEFEGSFWSSDQVSGQVVFAALQQSAGRRAILRDAEAFPIFIDAVRSIEPAVAQTLERVEREVDLHTADRLADAVRRIFGRVLKRARRSRKPDAQSPGLRRRRRRYLWRSAGELQRQQAGRGAPPSTGPRARRSHAAGTRSPRRPGRSPHGPARPARSSDLPSLAADPEPGEARSRFDADAGVVLYNDRHGDYLLVKEDEGALLDYLAVLVAKEYVVYNNPRSSSEDLGEEMVRMLVRVRRHLPRRR